MVTVGPISIDVQHLLCTGNSWCWVCDLGWFLFKWFVSRSRLILQEQCPVKSVKLEGHMFHKKIKTLYCCLMEYLWIIFKKLRKDVIQPQRDFNLARNKTKEALHNFNCHYYHWSNVWPILWICSLHLFSMKDNSKHGSLKWNYR